MQRSSGQRRYLATNSTQADFTTLTPVIANNRRTDYSTSGRITTLTPSAAWQVVLLDEYRGARITPIGVGDTTSNTYRLWAVYGGYAPTASLPDPKLSELVDLNTLCVGTGAFSLSTLAGPTSGTVVLPAEKIADTVSWLISTTATTPRGPQTAFESAYSLGATGAYSPGSNTPGCLIIPDFGSGVLGFIFEMAKGGAGVTSLNALYELTK